MDEDKTGMLESNAFLSILKLAKIKLGPDDISVLSEKC